jgi:hypothetical protein
MGLIAEVESALLELLDEDHFGSASLTVNSLPVVGSWQADDRSMPGQFPGQIVERMRLICAASAFSAEVGEEIDVNGDLWLVVGKRPMELTTDLTCERNWA